MFIQILTVYSALSCAAGMKAIGNLCVPNVVESQPRVSRSAVGRTMKIPSAGLSGDSEVRTRFGSRKQKSQAVRSTFHSEMGSSGEFENLPNPMKEFADEEVDDDYEDAIAAHTIKYYIEEVMGFVGQTADNVIRMLTDSEHYWEEKYAEAKRNNDHYGYSKVVDMSNLDCTPAGPNDSRSPCPFLNSLANCDLFPHDGKDIPMQQVKEALMYIANINEFLADTLVNGATPLGSTVDGQAVLSLSDLNVHSTAAKKAIEHDASFSRLNSFEGDNHTPNIELIDAFLDSVEGDYLKFEDIIHYRKVRLDQTRADPRHVKFAIGDWAAIHGETILLGGVMGRDYKISKAYLSTFFKEERFPEGWTIRSKTFGLKELLLRVIQVSFSK